jgi:hypothetical protein
MLRRLCLLVPVVSACSPWTDVSRPEDAPTASVLSPSDGAMVPAGRIELLGRANDTEDPPENLFVVWSLGTAADDGWIDACQGFASKGSGESLCVTEVDASVTRVRMLVKDVAGFQRVVTQALVVRDVVAPAVTVLPLTAAHFYADTPIAVEATVADDDGTVEDLALSWSSDVAGPVDGPTVPDPEGRLRGAVRLPEGSHTLTLSARDADNLLTRASVSLHVGPANVAPTVRIDAPTQDAVVAVGAPLDLLGVVLDSVTAPPSLVVSWSSDLDGLLGEPTPDALGAAPLPDVVLSKGDHTLTLSATDDAGVVGEASVALRVDDPPTLTLDGPTEGQTIVWPASLRVEATLTDSVSPSADLRLVVASDLSGALMDVGVNEGGHVVADVPLPLGTHVLTLQAVDGYGLVTGLTRTVSVVAP